MLSHVQKASLSSTPRLLWKHPANLDAPFSSTFFSFFHYFRIMFNQFHGNCKTWLTLVVQHSLCAFTNIQPRSYETRIAREGGGQLRSDQGFRQRPNQRHHQEACFMFGTKKEPLHCSFKVVFRVQTHRLLGAEEPAVPLLFAGVCKKKNTSWWLMASPFSTLHVPQSDLRRLSIPHDSGVPLETSPH